MPYAAFSPLDPPIAAHEDTKKTESDRLQLLCDAVSGMTDSYLVSIHDELSEVWHGGSCGQR